MEAVIFSNRASNQKSHCECFSSKTISLCGLLRFAVGLNSVEPGWTRRVSLRAGSLSLSSGKTRFTLGLIAMSKGYALRRLLAEKPFIVTPGITNALHALIVEKAGFEFAYVGGYDVSLTLLGLPDVGLITESEMVANARNIAGSVTIPVVADADTGYGNAINAIRTVQDYEAAGVAAIHIEDQISPKRCGHAAGKMIVPLEEAVGKLRAALDARRDKGLVIIGRTDAVSAVGGAWTKRLSGRGRSPERAAIWYGPNFRPRTQSIPEGSPRACARSFQHCLCISTTPRISSGMNQG